MSVSSFNIIKSYAHGDLAKATLADGTVVKRSQALLVPEWMAMVPCAPYDNHFLYANPLDDASAYMCTCGSPAVIAEPYDRRKSILVCLRHASEGVHAGGERLWQ